jgi:hypothetical protein
MVAAKRLNLLPSKQQQEAVSERERERVCVCVTRKQTQFFVKNQLRSSNSSSRLDELQTLKKLELEREEANQAGFV